MSVGEGKKKERSNVLDTVLYKNNYLYLLEAAVDAAQIGFPLGIETRKGFSNLRLICERHLEGQKDVLAYPNSSMLTGQL